MPEYNSLTLSSPPSTSNPAPSPTDISVGIGVLDHQQLHQQQQQKKKEKKQQHQQQHQHPHAGGEAEQPASAPSAAPASAVSVAVCLAGGLRTFDLTWASIRRHLLAAYAPCDLFVSAPVDADTHKMSLLAHRSQHVRHVSVRLVVETPIDLSLARAVLESSGSPNGLQVGDRAQGLAGGGQSPMACRWGTEPKGLQVGDRAQGLAGGGQSTRACRWGTEPKGTNEKVTHTRGLADTT